MSRNLRLGLYLLAASVVVGSVGYVVVEDFNVIDAVYMTVITITTVGFEEVGGPLSDGGRIWTMLVLMGGMGAALYTAFVGLEYLAETIAVGARARRRMEKALEHLKDHVVLCGFGRVGRTAFVSLHNAGVPVAVIDSSPEKVAIATQMGAYAIEGDATYDDVLARAGVERARTVIPAVAADSDNLVITLSAKAMNPNVLIVARAINEETEKKLFRAGADRVVAPQLVGGERLATLALRPNVAEFVDLVVTGRTLEFQVEEFIVGEDAKVVGKSLRALDLRNTSGAMVLAIGDGPQPQRISINPDPDHVFKAGQLVIGVGTESQLAALQSLVES